MANLIVSDEEIFTKFAQIVANSLRIDPAAVTLDANLSDLGAESLDLLEITMDAEEEFNVLIPQKNILQIAQDLFGPGVLVQDGVITETGCRFLRARMPEFDPTALGHPVTMADLSRQLVCVRTWVRMIGSLIEQSPCECPQCGAALSKAVAGRVKCGQCGRECDLPSGDDVNRQWIQKYLQAEGRPGAALRTA